MDILERVKDLCYKQGMTVAELERKADLGNGSVRRWDTSIPAADKLQRAAITLGTSMDYLLTGKEPREDSETLLLAREANSLTKEQLDAVKSVIDEFKRNNNLRWCDWIGKVKIIYIIRSCSSFMTTKSNLTSTLRSYVKKKIGSWYLTPKIKWKL